MQKFSSTQDIYEFAMQLEKEGEAFYLELASNTEDQGVKSILMMLADEEKKHFEVFKKMKEGSQNEPLPCFDSAKEVVKIFEIMKKEKSSHDFKINQIEYYKKALQIEQENENFYREQASKIENPKHKAILHHIADEEEKHLNILKNIIDFMAEPDSYLENAEFHRIS